MKLRDLASAKFFKSERFKRTARKDIGRIVTHSSSSTLFASPRRDSPPSEEGRVRAFPAKGDTFRNLLVYAVSLGYTRSTSKKDKQERGRSGASVMRHDPIHRCLPFLG